MRMMIRNDDDFLTLSMRFWREDERSICVDNTGRRGGVHYHWGPEFQADRLRIMMMIMWVMNDGGVDVMGIMIMMLVGLIISHHLAPVIPSGQFFICLRWKYLKFQLKILFLNSKSKKWALICLTKECEWAGITAANNQMFRAVWSHHRSLNNGKAPLQGNILIIDNSKNLTLFPTRCHWLQGETCAFFRIWSFSNFLLTWNPLSSHGGSCLQKQKQSTLDLRKIRY